MFLSLTGKCHYRCQIPRKAHIFKVACRVPLTFQHDFGLISLETCCGIKFSILILCEISSCSVNTDVMTKIKVFTSAGQDQAGV